MGWEAATSHVVLTVGFLVVFAASVVAVTRSRAVDRARQPVDDD